MSSAWGWNLVETLCTSVTAVLSISKGHHGRMLRVLGAIEIDGRGPIRSRRQRVLLAALAVDAGRTVSTGRLIELIWGDRHPQNPDAALHNHVSRVRSLLPPGCAIEAEPGGYRLETTPESLDLTAYETLLDAARNGSTEQRIHLFASALSLWRSEPFPELDDDRALAEGTRLVQRHRALREMLAESLIEAGRTREAIAELETLRRDDPTNEGIAERLMHAYVDVEDKSRALGVFRELREILAEQLGLDPSPTLRQLEEAIIREERVATGPNQRPSVAGAAHRPASIPVPVSSLVGRTAVLERLSSLLETERIVTVVGPGGVGKTRVATEAASGTAEMFEEVTMVDLSTVLAPDQVSEVVASHMGVQPRVGVPDVVRIVDAIGGRHILLVLDNCEHVIEAVTDLVHGVTSRSPALTVLATSREPLGIPGEDVVRLSPLDVAGDAVTLFVDRAESAVGHRVDWDETDRALAREICRLVDGLPLAIELAASRCGARSLEEIRDSLAEPLDLVARRRPHDRHGSLRSLVEWSVRDLDEALGLVFDRVTVFAGHFDADGAAALTGLSRREVATALVELAERSLLVVHAGRPGERTRFRCLATIRAFGRERLELSDSLASVLDRHRSWTLDLCEHAYASLLGPDGRAAYRSVIDSMAEVRVAHRHFVADSDADRALRLAASLHFIQLVQMQSEVGDWTMETADRFGSTHHRCAEQVLALASMAAWLEGDLDRGIRYAERAERAAARTGGSEAGRAASEAWADLESFRGDSVAALRRFERALDLARAAGNRFRTITNLADSALTAGYLGDDDTVRSRIAEARSMLTDDAAPAVRAWIAYAEGEGLAENDPDRALDALAEAMAAAHECGAAFVTCLAGLTRAGLQVRHGRADDALPALVDVLRHWRNAGAVVQQWIALRTAAEALVGLREYEAAAVVLGGVLDTASATTVGGTDAARLDAAHATVRAQLADPDAAFDRGSRSDVTTLIDDVIALFESHLTAN